MQRTALFVTGTLALIGVLVSAAPARAQYGAIAFDDENCAWGRSWNYSTPQQAATRTSAMPLRELRGARSDRTAPMRLARDDRKLQGMGLVDAADARRGSSGGAARLRQRQCRV
jgi:hypothetical protein